MYADKYLGKSQLHSIPHADHDSANLEFGNSHFLDLSITSNRKTTLCTPHHIQDIANSLPYKFLVFSSDLLKRASQKQLVSVKRLQV